MKLKPYAKKNDDTGSFVPGSLILSHKIPQGDVWTLVTDAVERNSVNTPQYDAVVKDVYPNAVYADTFGEHAKNFIQQNYGYSAENIVLSNSICSDDVDGPIYTDINNIGQNPSSVNQFLGAFMSGGLSGFPHTGALGIIAWASHATTTSGGALFLINTPHIGITQNQTRVANNDNIGRIQRYGKPDVGTVNDNTCGAVNAAISEVIRLQGIAPSPSAYPVDYQWYTLIILLISEYSYFNTHTYSENMKHATEIIRQEGDNFLRVNGQGISSLTVPSDIDLFYCSGTFINTDAGSLAYVNVDSFYHYKNGTWDSKTTEFLRNL